MTTLKFSLSPTATARVYESLSCLAKFGEYVSIEACCDKLSLTALNQAKTAYACFALDAKVFFVDYQFHVAGNGTGGDRFTCELPNRALQSVFKGRSYDVRGRESLVDRCDVTIQERPDNAECRLIVTMLCKHGVTKTYRLTYESKEVMHAFFDKAAANQTWRISSRVLREYIEFFGPKTEQLDLIAQEGKAIFTSFTEKVQNGKEVLKQPLETAIKIHAEDFEDFYVQQGVHIVISVKDFRAIVVHAETLRGPISAHFSGPKRPLRFSYQNFGMMCEFTLMTTGDYHGGTPTPDSIFLSNRKTSKQSSVIAKSAPKLGAASEMPPPGRPASSKPLSSQSRRPSLREQIRQPSVTESDPDVEGLFVQDQDCDRGWNPPSYGNDDGEEMLGWDASGEHLSATLHQTFRDSGTISGSRRQTAPSPAALDEDGLEPTQRLSQLHGLFD